MNDLSHIDFHASAFDLKKEIYPIFPELLIDFSASNTEFPSAGEVTIKLSCACFCLIPDNLITALLECKRR